MSPDQDVFSQLIAPLDPTTFFSEIWEKAPQHIRGGDESRFRSILTAQDVDDAITAGGLRYPSIQLVRDGNFFPPEAFTRALRSGDDVFTGVPVLERINAAFLAGATISLPGFQRGWQPLAELVGAVENVFDHPAHANVYITPANRAGFTPHYDTHEVFVLQIAGRKRWKIARPPITLPHRSQLFDPATGGQFEALFEFELVPGDVLYLPRGFVHSTHADGERSIHVTLGITVYTWVELLTEWAQSARAIPALRRALPPGFASRAELRATLAQELAAVIAKGGSAADMEALVDGFARRILTARSATRGVFHSDGKPGSGESG